jgi:DNA-binding FadR family transcriptional regulator
MRHRLSLAADQSRPAEVLRASFDFHVEVARIVGNPVFVAVLEMLAAGRVLGDAPRGRDSGMASTGGEPASGD